MTHVAPSTDPAAPEELSCSLPHFIFAVIALGFAAIIAVNLVMAPIAHYVIQASLG